MAVRTCGAADKRRDGVYQDFLNMNTRLSFRDYQHCMRHRDLLHGDNASLTPEEWSDRYQKYKTDFQRQSLWSFFLRHQSDEWFKEKYAIYAPYVEARRLRRRTGRMGHKEVWLHELESGALDKVCWDLQESGSSVPMYTVTNRLGNEEHFDTDQLPMAPDPEHQLLVRVWPADRPRTELEDHLSTYAGFRYVAMLEPIVQRRWNRAGIAVFEHGTDVCDAIRQLDGHAFGDFVLHLALLDRPSSSRVRIAPESTNTLPRLTHDLALSRQMIEKLEEEDRTTLFADECLIGGDTWAWLDVRACERIEARCAAMQGIRTEHERVKKQLDLQLDLLRRVYHMDYYLCLQCDFAEELERRSACHVRRQPVNDLHIHEDEYWTSHLDAKLRLWLAPAEALPSHGGIDRDALEERLTRDWIREMEPGKVRCCVRTGQGVDGECGKLFKAHGFVRKHIRRRHLDLLERRGGDTYAFAAYFNSYLCDPMRVSPSGLKDEGSEPRPLVAPSRAVDHASPRRSYQDLDGAQPDTMDLSY